MKTLRFIWVSFALLWLWGTVYALAQMMPMGGATVVYGGAPPTKVLTYQSSPAAAGSGATPSFTSVGIGTASASRVVHVLITGAAGTRTISSVTIGGVTATQNVVHQSSNTTAAIYSAQVPTGTTATIAITWSGSQSGTGISVWTSTGLSSATANDAQSTSSNNTNMGLATLASGFLVAGGTFNDNASTVTWTNATARLNIGTAFDGWGAADNTATSSGTTNVKGNYGGGGASIWNFVCASF